MALTAAYRRHPHLKETSTLERMSNPVHGTATSAISTLCFNFGAIDLPERTFCIKNVFRQNCLCLAAPLQFLRMPIPLIVNDLDPSKDPINFLIHFATKNQMR